MSTLVAFIRAEPARDVPIVPAGWELIAESDRWCSIYPLTRARNDVIFHARLILRQPAQPGRALFVCTGRAVVLDRLAAAIAADNLAWTRTWPTLEELRIDPSPAVAALRSAWPDGRVRPVLSGVPGEGTMTVGAPIGQLVALRARIAGHETEDGES